MAGVRIKDLQDAKGIVDKFDDFQFAVDSSNPDTTMRLSGKEVKKAIGTAKHTHPIEEVDGLPGVLEKKLDTTGARLRVTFASRATPTSKTYGWTNTSKSRS